MLYDVFMYKIIGYHMSCNNLRTYSLAKNVFQDKKSIFFQVLKKNALRDNNNDTSLQT